MNSRTKIVILAFCIVKLALHLIADSHSGFQGDELLHIETGHNLAFGFMEFPPLIGLLAFIQNMFQSESVFVHHIFPHIAALLILIFVSKITVELGGKTKAVIKDIHVKTPPLRSPKLRQHYLLLNVDHPTTKTEKSLI